MQTGILKSDLSVGDIIGHAVIWILLSIVTFGLALFVFPYYMARFIIGRTNVVDASGMRIGRLECTIDLASIVGNIVIWAIISVLTLGLGYIVFMYKIYAHCLNHTKIAAV
ncbi:hypothetical protein SBC1_12750 [Caballeronia sp. SBC1]|uniref:DUF898 domain-containing protein n=1 Tax=unclassified Caballeronia TaxID=2646786 RepID=UPI0013E18CDF|nr:MULTISPECIES: DUF898 domain-containing protein [unclassified Caballeronia]QIE23392.1 hypothetical protein SBC2_14160 [Caballeronia sp. SBC2]QIN61285.1 hypothetical protein SBC1_12750 [Caballeronia sp. SBC1]